MMGRDTPFWRWMATEHWTVQAFRMAIVLPVLAICCAMIAYYTVTGAVHDLVARPG